jgi:3-deoxy-D-manno-octulosonic-acid transferase
MFWLYNVLWLLAFPGVFGYLVLRSLFSGKYRHNLRPRLGLGLKDRPKTIDRRVIWVHALSVGEVLSAVSLLHNLRDEFPQYELFFTTTSETGQQVAQERLAGLNCRFSYLPLDLWWIVRRMVKTIGARLFVLVETDLWPNLLWCLAREGTPVVLVNGKISDRSFPRYRLGRRFISEAFNNIDVLCMQSEEDGRRMRMLGVKASKVEVTGNIKFDQPSSKSVRSERDQLKRELGWIPPSATWIAGSTHPGEEYIILKVYAKLREEFPTLGLILAPRSQQRFAEVFGMVKKRGWQTARRSQLSGENRRSVQIDVLVLDTLGELASFYSLGNFAFVGGSLVNFGGHNPLEPAQRGLPVVFGPHMENFKEVSTILTESGGGFQISTEAELFEQVKCWLVAPAKCKKQGEKALGILEAHQGAVARSMEVIRGLLKSSRTID